VTGRAIVVWTDYTSSDVRRVAQRVKNAAQARRRLATSLDNFKYLTWDDTPVGQQRIK
jgi:hypothetical protein